MDVVSTVFGFVKKQMGTGMTVEHRECSLPPLQYATRAFWLDVGVSSKANVEAAGRDFEVHFALESELVLKFAFSGPRLVLFRVFVGRFPQL